MRGSANGDGVNPYQRAEFKARKIQVKGFVDWEKRKEEAMTHIEATNWIKSIHEELDDEQKKKIDLVGTLRSMNRVFYHRLDIIVADGPSQDIWNLQKLLKGITEDNPDTMNINNKKPRFVVEPPPWKVPLLRAGGRMLSALSREGVPFEATKTEWNYPLTIYLIKDAERPRKICAYDAKTDTWQCDEETIKIISVHLTGEQLIRTYNNM